MFGSFSKRPGGNVEPSRFVKLQTDDTVVHATAASDELWGISQPSVRRLALSGWDDGYAGISGDGAINIFGPGDDKCKLQLGGTVTIGAKLTATTAGKGVASTTDKDHVGAIAMQAGVDGDIIDVKPVRFDAGV
jgi:hypothetical protein